MSNKNTYVFFSVALTTLFIVLASQIVMAGPPSVPITTIHGVATINGEVAPEGTIVEAFMNGNCVKKDTVSASGKYALAISGGDEDLGKTLSFYVNGIKVSESETLKSEDYSLDLAVEGSSEPKKKSSGSGSKASLVSSDKEISGSDSKITEPDEEPEAALLEEHNGSANVKDKVGDESEDTASDEKSQDLPDTKTPGFNFAYALMGMIFICFMSDRKRLR